ncbi:MAG: DUF4150 domain-containing protein [Vicinamibacterales bacterium]
MPVTVKVNGAANSLVHKGSNHVSIATIPDVCKTPSPGGPVPIPYPNVSQSAMLAKGTTTVKADGGMMIAIKGSEFSLSNGDNAGVAGGVKSSTFMKESTWILYSFDVKMEGKGACRLSDKKFQNHENAADLQGAVGPPVPLTTAQIKDLLCQDCCNHEIAAQKPGGKRSSNALEKQCQADPKYSGQVLFRTSFASPPGTSTKKTRPDAIKADQSQCFDFKLCGDSFRGDQKDRQAGISGGADPIEISCKACTKCNPSCTCPK